MTIKMYGIKNCDSVKKAQKLLKNDNIDFTFFDFKKETPDDKDIKRWIKNFGADKIINRRGTTWRKLSDNEKQKAESSIDEQVALIQSSLSLIKRPIIESQKGFSIGYDETSIKNIV